MPVDTTLPFLTDIDLLVNGEGVLDPLGLATTSPQGGTGTVCSTTTGSIAKACAAFTRASSARLRAVEVLRKDLVPGAGGRYRHSTRVEAAAPSSTARPRRHTGLDLHHGMEPQVPCRCRAPRTTGATWHYSENCVGTGRCCTGWASARTQPEETEPSFLALGISRSRAIAFGRKYGQLAIVLGSVDAGAELVACEPPIETDRR